MNTIPQRVLSATFTLVAASSLALEPKGVLNTMERVADWQLAHPSRHPRTDWTQGAGDAGMMALAGISGSPKYLEAMLAMGETNAWRLGPRNYHADDHCVGQTYVELWLRHREPRMLAPMRERFDFVLAHPREFPSLDFKQKGVGDLWSWCDALFMAPPAWMRLYAATGDARYLDFAVANWWRTSDYLYDKEEHLYFRDSNYFEKREANGKKVFWSRGNGWVMGGLVRVLQFLPANHPSRERFLQQYREMAAKILACQQDDGLWRSSLLDPVSYPLKETSGSGFYTYALAWGVNEGLLDRAKFRPAVEKAWAALLACVAEDGKLTHVQPIGADPKKFDENATEVYGVGAFLLAGSEIYRMAVLDQAKPVTVSVSNPGVSTCVAETVELDLAGLPTNPAVMEGVSSRVLDSQVVGGKLIFQVDLQPSETRSYRILDAALLAATPKPIVKTFARFVPERMDDFAWESDRIAHRMYGPALIQGEGTISSGVDVWLKRTRKLVLNDWYQSGHYHEDRGEGLDCYKVGPSRGCGGLGIWDGKQLRVSSNFKSQRVIATGPVRSVFELTYESWDAAGRKVSEVKRMSIDANANFTRCESVFGGEGGPLRVGVGLVRRAGEGRFTQDRTGGWMSYWEPEQGTNGHTACAIIVPGGVKEFAEDKDNFLALADIQPGKPFVYFLGAGWSKSGDYPDASTWEHAVKAVAARPSQPLKVQRQSP